MPYSFPNNIPDVVKSLPVGAQKIFINVFNENIDKGEDEARQAAWGAVKNKYEKNDEGEWIKKTKESLDLTEEKLSFDFSLSEAQFDEKEKTALVTIIKEGWSLNSTEGKRRYYTLKAVKDVVEQLSSSRKMYLDHSSNPNRSPDDWTATIKEAWLDGDSAKAKIDFTENPKTVWLFKEAQKHPEEVQLSIDGKGSIRFGKVNGEEAAVVESIKRLFSVDFVNVGAAGGKIDRVAASAEAKVLSEAISSLEDMIKTRKEKQEPWNDFYLITDALNSFLWDLVYASDVSKEDVATNISSALKTFETQISDAIEKIKKTQESVINKENKMKLQELKEKEPEAYSSLVEQAELIAKNDAEKAVKENMAKVEKEKEEVSAKLSETEKKLLEAQTKLDAYEQKEKEALKKQNIANKLKEAKLEGKVSEEFVNMLEKLEDSMVDVVLAERVKLAEMKPVPDNPPNGKKLENEKKELSLEDKKKLIFS